MRRLLRTTIVAMVGVVYTLAFISVCSAKEAGHLKVRTPSKEPGTLHLHWKGRVGGNMAQDIETAFQKRKEQVRRVVFTIESGGGNIAEGERAIEILRRIRKTHQLETVVSHGKSCGSMCVFIYMQGQKRTAALTSSWLFHEASRSKDGKVVSLNRRSWERLIELYFVPEGVSREWIAQMKPMTHRNDYWQTGADLVSTKSGIIHEALGNQKARKVHNG